MPLCRRAHCRKSTNQFWRGKGKWQKYCTAVVLEIRKAKGRNICLQWKMYNEQMYFGTFIRGVIILIFTYVFSWPESANQLLNQSVVCIESVYRRSKVSYLTFRGRKGDLKYVKEIRESTFYCANMIKFLFEIVIFSDWKRPITLSLNMGYNLSPSICQWNAPPRFKGSVQRKSCNVKIVYA